MKMLYIIRGIPGSGKSTMAKKLAPNAAFEADAYMMDQQGNYAFDPSRLGEVHQKCYEAVRDALMQDIANVAVANTFVKRWEYQKYVDLANELGVKYEIIVCNGGYKNIHGVPEEAIQRMKDNWEDTMNEEDNKTEDMNIMNNDIDERYKETSPFPIKEQEPMKIMIKAKDNSIEEYNLWYVNMDPAEMSSMSIVKATYEAQQMLRKIQHMCQDYVTIDRVDDISHFYAYEALIVFVKKVDAVLYPQRFKLEDNGSLSHSMTTRRKIGEENFSPLHAYSMRVIKETPKESVINEMYVSEMTGETKHGWRIEFKSVTYNKRGQHYVKTWPGVLYLNNTSNGYRLMWSDKKTKTPIWAVSYGIMARRKMVPSNAWIETCTEVFCEDLLKPKDVLPILEYMPLEHTGKGYNSIYPHGITQSDIYWVGGEKSTKKILNKAYMHPHGVTKKIFGDINNIKTFSDLRTAIVLLRLARGFSPQALEKLDLFTVENFYKQKYGFEQVDVIKKIKSFFTHFGYKDEYLIQMFSDTSIEVIDAELDTFGTMHKADNVVDTARTFSQIRGRNHRTAIKQHVARSRMNIEQIHEFVTLEFNKIQTENKELKKTKFYKTFAEFDRKWLAPVPSIAAGIQMVVPKVTHDLVEWGATQNNCIGTYAERVYQEEVIVIGFKSGDGKWIGHAEIRNDMTMVQLLGKHNSALPKDTRALIIEFLKDKVKVKVPGWLDTRQDNEEQPFR